MELCFLVPWRELRTEMPQEAFLSPCKPHTWQELGEWRAGVGKPLGKCHKYLSVFPEIAEPVHALLVAITSLCEKLFVLVFALGKCPTQIH